MKQGLLSAITCLAISIHIMAQADSLQLQINNQVWKPFIHSFNNLDTKGFMAVHSKEMTRVVQDDKRVFGWEQYYRNNESGDQRARNSKSKRTLELRFTQRIAGNDRAFEVGYYKYTSIQPDGTRQQGYGKFHVLLRREAGVWKILMDADAHENTNEAIFQGATPM